MTKPYIKIIANISLSMSGDMFWSANKLYLRRKKGLINTYHYPAASNLTMTTLR